MKISKPLAAFIAAGAIQLAHAQTCTAPFCVAPTGGAVEGQNQRTDNRVYAGLAWVLGGKLELAPSLQIGVRSLAVKSDNSVSGGDLSLRLNVFSGPALDSIRLVYVGGNRDIQGNLGAGYSFVASSVLGLVGVQVPYVRAGTDYVYGSNEFKPYVEINTFSKPRKVERGSNAPLACQSGHVLIDAPPYVDPSQIKDGKTCVTPA